VRRVSDNQEAELLPPGVRAIEERPEGDSLRCLHDNIRSLLHTNRDTLRYHGWPHIRFVATHAIDFAQRHALDETLVGSAALVHDLNYIVRPNSAPSAGFGIAAEQLAAVGFPQPHIDRVAQMVNEAYTAVRGPQITPEAACLSDADSLFKALPFTPLLLVRAYMQENGVTIQDMAAKIVAEQKPLLDGGHYFYLATARDRYEEWARANIMLWQRTLDALADDDLSWLATQLSHLD
jgi:hypothetical protein